ncbi:TonB family protein [Acidithiobacillus sp. AMEEHan]|uniref:energy transducer TonB n=1 Tax=Acidithiobacillus sp. AMEEHan TaxID=2994951 RepID=UPI0027E4B883|nr:TonB family protein [Acidithiobacillus sp. AMEEHan]
MGAVLSNRSSAPQPKGYFGRALIIGAVIEIALVAGLIWVSNQKSPPPPPKPKRIAIHMVQPPKPKPLPPPPKPVVHPKPVPKPLPKPIPRPVPRPVPHPVVHHAPTPKPLVAKAPLPTAPVVPPAPPVTPPPPPPPAPSPALAQAAVARYAALVRAQVQSQARVPEAVRLMHLSGKAVISFELLPSGSLVWAKLAQSSGVGAIDRAALAAVKAGVYPPFTKDMPKKATIFDVEVHLSANS